MAHFLQQRMLFTFRVRSATKITVTTTTMSRIIRFGLGKQSIPLPCQYHGNGCKMEYKSPGARTNHHIRCRFKTCVATEDAAHPSVAVSLPPPGPAAASSVHAMADDASDHDAPIMPGDDSSDAGASSDEDASSEADGSPEEDDLFSLRSKSFC